jgi:prepilin-type N-terminal cleavage/methylation domain-containing protein
VKNKGLTLVEILVVTVLAGVVLSVVSTVLVEYLKAWQREESQFARWQAGDKLMNDMKKDIRRAFPGGAGYKDGVLEIKISGAFDGARKGSDKFIPYTIRYYMQKNGEPRVVREAYANDERLTQKVYKDVTSFRVAKSEDSNEIFKIEIFLGRDEKDKFSVSARAPSFERVSK